LSGEVDECKPLVVGLFATVVFGMSATLGLSLGFILGAVSPAVVVLGMFDLQSRGYGISKVGRCMSSQRHPYVESAWN
jgi:hypothetical protein